MHHQGESSSPCICGFSFLAWASGLLSVFILRVHRHLPSWPWPSGGPRPQRVADLSAALLHFYFLGRVAPVLVRGFWGFDPFPPARVSFILHKVYECFEMASALDSQATFVERVNELGLGEHLEQFKRNGWVSFATLAFSTDYIPGVSSQDGFLNDIVLPGLGKADHPHKLLLRRLFYEAYALGAADLKRRSLVHADDTPVQVPNTEREARWTRLVNRLQGLTLSGELEPSHHLQDFFNECADRNSLKYPEWEECTKRDQELQGVKKDMAWKVDPATNLIKLCDANVPQKASWQSDLQLRYLLQRRGLALELSGLMSFDEHEKIVNLLFNRLADQAPPGYARVSLDQIHRGDREIFKALAVACRAGIRRDGMGVRPLEAALPSILINPDIRLYLMPLPAGGQGSKRPGTSLEQHEPKIKKKKSQNERRKAQLAQAQLVQSQIAPANTFQKGKGKGKGAPGAGTGPRMPSVLQGKSHMTKAGERICFGFNMASGCKACKPGESCPRGRHVCAEPGCEQNHSLLNHA